MDKKKMFTVGYTLFRDKIGINLEQMFETLRNYGVTHLVDVRSVPFSKQYPQCNSDNLSRVGTRFSISYIHVPELGAKASPQQDVFSKAEDIFFDNIFPIAASSRPEKIELKKEDEIVDFNKFRNDEFFLQGIKRTERAYDKNFTLALMCSEKNPMNCHRYFLVSRKIEQTFGDWVDVEHIIEDESTIEDKSKKDTITPIVKTNKELDEELKAIIFKKKEVKKLVVKHQLQESEIPFEEDRKESVFDKYFGNDYQSREKDFCDRYWNLMHGWKNISSNNINLVNYD